MIIFDMMLLTLCWNIILHQSQDAITLSAAAGINHAMTWGHHGCCSSQLPLDGTQRTKLNRNNPPGWGYTSASNLNKGMLLRDLTERCNSCPASFLHWEQRNNLLLAHSTSSLHHLLASATSIGAEPSQARACFPLPPFGGVRSTTNLCFFPCHGLGIWNPRFHHRSQAGTSLLSAEGKIKDYKSSPFSYRRHLGGSGFRGFLPKLPELWPSRYCLDSFWFLIKRSLVEGN